MELPVRCPQGRHRKAACDADRWPAQRLPDDGALTLVKFCSIPVIRDHVRGLSTHCYTYLRMQVLTCALCTGSAMDGGAA